MLKQPLSRKLVNVERLYWKVSWELDYAGRSREGIKVMLEYAARRTVAMVVMNQACWNNP